MAITGIREIANRTSTIGDKNQRTYQRTWLIETDDPLIGAGTVRASVGINRGDIYNTGGEYDAGAFALDVAATNISEDGLSWHVTVDYGPFPEGQVNPLFELPEVSISYQQFSRPIEQDIDGNAIVNSAGLPYSTATEIDDSRPVLSITKNVLTFNPMISFLYRDKINADVFYGAPPGTVKIMSISASNQQDGNIGQYWKVSFSFQLNVEGWDRYLLDQGRVELVSGEYRAIVNDDGSPVSEDALLDGSGQKLPAGGTPVFSHHQVYNRVPFALLGL